MYSTAQDSARQIWSHRLVGTAGALFPLLVKFGRQGDAVFCFKIVTKRPWAISDCDSAAEKMMMAGLTVGVGASGSNLCDTTSMAMRDGKVLKADVANKKTNPASPLRLCASCGEEEKTFHEFQSCGGCRNAAYCSKGCQKAHWKHHKLSCGT